MFSPLGEACAYRLFEGNACRVRVKQYVRISGFDIDVTALFRDDIEQGGATVTVGLADDIQIVGRLVAHTTSINRNPRLRSVESDEVLCDVVPNTQVDGCSLAACNLNTSRVCGDGSLIAIEKRQTDVEYECGVVERLANRTKISGCIKGFLRKTAVWALVTTEDTGVGLSRGPVRTNLRARQRFVRALEGQIGAMIHCELQKLLPVIILRSRFKLSLQPNHFIRVYAHRFLESQHGNLSLRLILNSQRFDAVYLNARFIRIERRGGAFACTILHQSKEIAIQLEKLFDKLEIAYGSECPSEAHAYFSGEQALLVRDALLRGGFFTRGDH